MGPLEQVGMSKTQLIKNQQGQRAPLFHKTGVKKILFGGLPVIIKPNDLRLPFSSQPGQLGIAGPGIMIKGETNRAGIDHQGLVNLTDKGPMSMGRTKQGWGRLLWGTDFLAKLVIG